MWFQHEGASVPYVAAARDFLNRRFGEKWISRGGSQFWPPRSPDLNPINFYIWSYMKSIVLKSVDKTEQRAVANIQSNSKMFSKTHFSIRKRCKMCF